MALTYSTARMTVVALSLLQSFHLSLCGLTLPVSLTCGTYLCGFPQHQVYVPYALLIVNFCLKCNSDLAFDKHLKHCFKCHYSQ